MPKTIEMKDPFLIALTGPLKGKKFKIRSEKFILGSAGKSDIAVPGSSVAEVHAVIRKNASGQWEIRNKSPQGTLINKARADIHTLQPGDTVQVGEQVLFKFDCRKSVFKGAMTRSPATAGKEKQSLFKKPAVVIGVVAYLIAMAVLLLLLQADTASDSDAGITADYVDEALDATAEYLRASSAEKTGLSKSATESALDANIERATDYFIAIYSPELDRREAAIQRLAVKLRESFFRAWQFEKRDQFEAAVAEYEFIGQMVPDPRAPVNAVALWRLSEIGE